MACPSFGTKCPKLHGDYVGNASRLFSAPALPSHIPPEKRTEKRGLDGDYSENLPWLSRLHRCPLIYHQKNGANGDGSRIFFEKPPLTNRDILGCFSDWPSGNFSKSFLCSPACPAGGVRYSVAEKNFLSYTVTFFCYFQVGEKEKVLVLFLVEKSCRT